MRFGLFIPRGWRLDLVGFEPAEHWAVRRDLAALRPADSMTAGTSRPESAIGTPEQVIERLERIRDLGCECAICYFPEAVYDRSGIEMFECEVIPALS